MRTVAAAAALAILTAMLTALPLRAQTPPGLPPPGAYLPIPNFTGVGAGAQFRAAINDRFSGSQAIAPAVVSPDFASLPTEQDGLMVYCANCIRATPCASGGQGAWALGTRGQWSCSPPPLESSLNANGNKVISLASGANAGDALAFGQTAAQLNTLSGFKGDGSDSIFNFNVNGVLNVRAFGAKGDGVTDDTNAIQATYTAACSAATNNPTQAPTVYLPAGRYLISFPIIMNCSAPINIRGDGEQTSTITSGQGLFPLLYIESPQNLGSIGTFTAASLATGSGNSLNFPSGANWYLRLNDATQGDNQANAFQSAAAINGLSALSIELFFKYTGTANGTYYLMSSRGTDLSQPGFGALDLFLAQSGSGNSLSACLTTSGSGRVCINNAGSVSANAVHALQLSYDGSAIRLFLDGSQIGSSAAATGTIVQQPAEEFALGALSNFLGGINPGGQVWAGQIDSIRISNIARNTSNFTTPTAKFTADSNTAFLMNITSTRDTLVMADDVFGTGSKPWLPIRNWALVGNSLQNRVSALTLTNGTFGVLGVGTLYPNLDHLRVSGSVAAVNFYNNCYGGHYEHLFLTPSQFAEAALELQNNSGLVQADWLTVFPGYYGLILGDSGGNYAQLFITPGSQTINDIDASASTVFSDYVFQEPEIDFENGGTQVPFKISNGGTYEVVGGDLQYTSTSAVQIFPGNNPPGITMVGTHAETTSLTTPAIDFVAGGSPMQTPVTWIDPVVNGKSIVNSGVPIATDLTKVQTIGDASSIQQLSGARVDGGNTINGYSVNSVPNVQAYGAACSITTATATASAGNVTVTVSAIGDFKVGQNVKLDHAGASSTLATPSITSVQPSSYGNNPRPVSGAGIDGYAGGATCTPDTTGAQFHNANCTTSYCYSIVNAAQNGSWSAPSASSCVSSAPSTVSSNNNLQVKWTTDPNAVGTLIYRCTGSSCTPSGLYAVLPNLPVGQASGAAFTYVDMGNTFGQDEDFGTTKQSGAVAADLLTTITAINGTSVTLANAPSQSGSFTLRHDDAPAFQAAINASCQNSSRVQNCATVFVPGCANPYTLGQAVSFYGLLGAGLRGAGDTGTGAWASQIEWDGATGGIVFNLNKAGFGRIENLAIPGTSGNTPGIAIDFDNHNGTGPGTTIASAATVPTRWKFIHDECGQAGICFANCTGAINANCENTRYEDDWVDIPGAHGGWSGIYFGDGQAYDSVVEGGQAANRDYGINFTGVGSATVHDYNLSDNVIDFFSRGANEYIVFDTGVSESAQYFLYSPSSFDQETVRGFRLGDGANPDGYVIYRPHGNFTLEDTFIDTNFTPTPENIGIGSGGSDDAAPVFINNVYGNELKNENAGGNYPATPGNAPFTDENGGQKIPSYIEIGDRVGDSAAGFSSVEPFVVSGRTQTNLGITVVNGNLVSSPDSSDSLNGRSQSAAPTLSSCGTSPAVGATSNNTAMTLTIGSGTVTSCAVTFSTSQPFANAPVCTVQDITQGIALKQSSLTATGVTLGVPSGVSSIGGDTVNATCVGK
jgi:hypothetical protein